MSGGEAESFALIKLFALQTARSYEILDAGIGFHYAMAAVHDGQSTAEIFEDMDTKPDAHKFLNFGATLAGGLTRNMYGILLAIFKGYNFYLIAPPPTSDFLISDNPVSKVFLASAFRPVIPSPSHSNFKIIIPISPQLAICGFADPYLDNLRDHLKKLRGMRSYIVMSNAVPQFEFLRAGRFNKISREIDRHERELAAIQESGLLEIDQRKCDALNLDQFILAREHLASETGDFARLLRLLKSPKETFMSEFI